jgi:hypothetical protein
MTRDEIISALEKVSFELPSEALNAAEASAADVKPVLLDALARAANEPAPLLENHEYQLHIYAIYLLAKLRETAAYPDLVKLFNLPDEQPLDLTGDVLIEDGPLLLASVFDGDVSPIKAIIENEAAVPLLRTSAIAALPLLYMWGERTREEVIAYFRSLFNGRLPRPGATTVWAGLVTCCGHMQARELAAEVRGAYAAGLILADALPHHEIDAALAGMRPQMVERFIRRYRPINSTAEAISWWRCFNMKKDAEPEAAPAGPAREDAYGNLNLGRNDPCPCGSGRKYKKCHGT